MILAAQLYTVLTGSFPKYGTRCSRNDSKSLEESMTACAEQDKFQSDRQIGILKKTFHTYIADVRSLVQHFSKFEKCYIRSHTALEHVLMQHHLESRTQIREYFSQKKTALKRMVEQKASRKKKKLKTVTKTKTSPSLEDIHLHNKDSNEFKLVKTMRKKLPPGITHLPRDTIPDRSILFGNIELECQENIKSAIIVQEPKEMDKPCVVPYFMEPEDEPTFARNIYIIENTPCQVIIYHNLHKCLHYGSKSYIQTKDDVHEFSKKKEVGNICKPKTLSFTNNDGRNCNQEITVLNHGTQEYLNSAIPSMNFDVNAIARLLICIMDDENNTEMMKKVDGRNVAQYNFGYASSHCPDVHRCDESDTVLLTPKVLGINAKFTPIEVEGATQIQETFGVLADAMQGIINENLCSNNGKPMNDNDRNKTFAAEINKRTGSKICCGEAFSLNFQYLGEVSENNSETDNSC